MQQHPFSISSSAVSPRRLEFTIRELGDFTSTIGSIKPGSTAFVEGPYGAFVPDLSAQRSLVLIAGGVGIAPMMSILRTLRDRKDSRRVLLLYGNYSHEQIIFENELKSLQQALPLEVVFVLEKPDDSLSNDPGRIREELLERHVSADGRDDFEYFICGPVAMMDMAERYLVRKGVPPALIHSERFDIA
jgi:predicted ferric reductase